MIVKYTNSRKNKLEIQYQSGLPIAPVSFLPVTLERKEVKGLAESVPSVRINGKCEISYEQWPMIESPYVKMNDSILIIDDGQSKIVVNWTGDYPIIKRGE